MVLLLILSLGEYGVFDTANDIKTGIIPESDDGDKSVKVYSFSKQVYGESYKPSGKILNSLDVASYITSQRLGDCQKMGMIVLNNQKKITGNIFLPYTDFANIDDIANDIAYYTSTMGGNAAILFGNIPLSKLEGKGLSDKVKNYSSVVLGYLELEGGRYNSALDRGIRFSVEKDGNIKPIGKGVFGNVYNQFKGKPKEALAFFKKNRQGDLLGVFYRDGVGDIDFVWGDDKSGLSHINNKHVGKSKSFHSLDEAVDHIENIINLGKIAFRNGDKILIKKGDEVVTLRRNVRGNGKKIADKNWILTA